MIINLSEELKRHTHLGLFIIEMAVLVGLLAGCAAPEPDFMVGNLAFHVKTDEVEWIKTPESQQRLAVMVEAITTYLGKTPADIPKGSMALIFDEDASICGGRAPACWDVEDGDHERPDGKSWVIWMKSDAVGIGPPVTCPERMPLMHELAHGLLDANPDNWYHQDKELWNGIDGLWLNLLSSAIQTYGDC